VDDENEDDEPLKNEETEKKLNLNQQRLGTVVAVLKSVNAKKVIDLGAGRESSLIIVKG